MPLDKERGDPPRQWKTENERETNQESTTQEEYRMIRNPWTSVLVTAGVISAASVLQAEEGEQHPVVSALQSTTISGYVDTSGIWLFEGGGTQLPGRSFDGSTKQNGFNLNVFSLAIEKPLDDANWAAGYRAQLLFGPDANALGSLSPLGTSSGDFAVKNAYVSLRAPLGNGLKFKAGVWDTVVGYEVFEAGNNPNYSRSYGYYIEPIVHTGVLASYDFTQWLSINGGVANGVADRTVLNKINNRALDDDGTVAAGKLSYLGSLALTAPESLGFLAGSILYGGIVDTGIGEDAYGGDDVINFYAGLTLLTPWKALSIGAAYDYQSNGAFDNSYANALAGYASLRLTEKLKLNGRVDYATGSPTTFGVATGNDVELLGVVGTLDYSLWANAITRLEFRWDNDLSGDGAFIDGTKTSAMSLALNVIYRF